MPPNHALQRTALSKCFRWLIARGISFAMLLLAFSCRASAEDFTDAIHTYLQQTVDTEKIIGGVVVGIVDEHERNIFIPKENILLIEGIHDLFADSKRSRSFGKSGSSPTSGDCRTVMLVRSLCQV